MTYFFFNFSSGFKLIYDKKHCECRNDTSYYNRRQINLYSMFFANFSVNSQPIWSRGDYRKIFSKKYSIFQKLDHLTCSKFENTTSLYKPYSLYINWLN